MAREIKGVQAADILGVTPRRMRRMRAACQAQVSGGLSDRSRGRPSGRQVPGQRLEKVLRFYTTDYFDFRQELGDAAVGGGNDEKVPGGQVGSGGPL